MNDQSKRRGIRQHYEFIVKSIDPAKKKVTGLYGYELSYDLLFMIPPQRPAQVLLDSRLADTEKRYQGRLRYPGYQVGQCLRDRRLRRYAGVEGGCHAHQEADLVAHNLTVQITGGGEPMPLHLHTI